MSDLISIGHLSALIQDQIALSRWLEDHGEQLPDHDPIFPERNEAMLDVDGERWSVDIGPRHLAFTNRGDGRTVLLARDQGSPFDVHPRTLLRYIHSIDEDSRLTDVVVDNWILANFRLGRLLDSPHQSGYYTFR